MKINLTIILLTFTSFLLPSKNAVAQNFKIDPGHSSVQIEVERFGVVDVVGRFKDLSGSIQFNKDDIASTAAEVSIKVNSYDANNPGGETAVKSKAFLDAEAFPDILFTAKSSRIKNGEKLLVGDLTIHGTTKQIELPFNIKGPLLDLPTKKQSIAFTAFTTLNRRDFGVSFDRKLPNGTMIVGNDVKITIKVLAIEE